MITHLCAFPNGEEGQDHLSPPPMYVHFRAQQIVVVIRCLVSSGGLLKVLLCINSPPLSGGLGWAEGGLVNHIQMELLLLPLSYQHTNIIVTI